jgi:hypothetical protein
VATLLLAVPTELAVLHQICATVLLTSALLIAHAVRFAPWRVGREPGRRAINGMGHGQTPQRTPFHGSVTPPARTKTTAPRSIAPGSDIPGSPASGSNIEDPKT